MIEIRLPDGTSYWTDTLDGQASDDLAQRLATVNDLDPELVVLSVDGAPITPGTDLADVETDAGLELVADG